MHTMGEARSLPGRRMAIGIAGEDTARTEDLVCSRRGVTMDVRVLETTIRDGGYELSHQFTEEDVALVVSTLEAAGVSLIEIGYGMGVGSHTFANATRPKERAAVSDQAHMTTARAAAPRAKLGVLYACGDVFCPVDYL